MELPAMNIGNTKTLLRFAPKDLAAWAREAPYCFRGPARAITDWMEEQAVRRGGPRFLLPPLPKVLEQINYDWLNAARSMKVAARPTISIFRLMDDFCESVKKLPLAEQRQLLEDIESGKVNSPTFTCEDAE
jgi:hypothetical protein